MLHRASNPIIKAIPLEIGLSRGGMMKWQKISKSNSAQLKKIEFKWQLDESTLPGKESLLCVCSFGEKTKVCFKNCSLPKFWNLIPKVILYSML